MTYTKIMKTFVINEIEKKRVLGRTKMPQDNTKPLPLFWAASALEICVKSKEVWIEVSADYNDQAPWIAVEVNGYLVNRFIAPKEKSWICISRGMTAPNGALISIYKDTQPMPDDVKHSLLIHQVGLADDGVFCDLPERSMNIEFIGDSITSGEGLAGNPDEMDWISQWMCGSKTYAAQVAKTLNANLSTVSQCGWGIVWGWDGNRNSNIPSYYNQICGIMKGDYQAELGAKDAFDFSVKNDFVVVNLGTNDNGAFFQAPWKDENGKEYVLHTNEDKSASKEDGEQIVQGVINFLKNIREKNPVAKIIWVWGMIKLETVPACIVAGIEEYKKMSGDKNVYSLELDAMENVEVLPEDKGSRGHPGPKTHRLAAEKIIECIKSLNK